MRINELMLVVLNKNVKSIHCLAQRAIPDLYSRCSLNISRLNDLGNETRKGQLAVKHLLCVVQHNARDLRH